jgi:hypothetical protein
MWAIVSAPLAISPPETLPTSSGTRSFARLRAGRLVGIRARRLADLGDVERLNAEVFAAIDRAGPGAIVCADHRLASPFTRDVADAWARAMRGANRDIGRSAILLDPANVTYNLQIERIVRCACNSSRRLFSSGSELRAWMDGVMTEHERSDLPLFLSEGDAG